MTGVFPPILLTETRRATFCLLSSASTCLPSRLFCCFFLLPHLEAMCQTQTWCVNPAVALSVDISRREVIKYKGHNSSDWERELPNGLVVLMCVSVCVSVCRCVIFNIWSLSLSVLVFVLLVSQEEHETSYTILRARGCNVSLNGLKPNTAYLLQIRARTAAGYGASSPSFQFETSPDCELRTHTHCSMLKICWVSQMLVLLYKISNKE